mgnify:CR=1 FL=1
MKHLAPGLLLSYAVYTAFVPVSIAHSIIIFALAALTGFEIFINVHQTPSIEKKVSDVQLEMDKRIAELKETYEIRLKKIEADQERQAFEKVNTAPNSKRSAPVMF